jgi:hypothetical protein
MAPVLHMVLYTFKASLSATDIQESQKNMLSLKERCLNPTTGKPYIVSMIAGSNLVTGSPYSRGYTHGLLMEFANKKDWLYYMKEDPAHTEFIETNQDWEPACVIDVGGGQD